MLTRSDPRDVQRRGMIDALTARLTNSAPSDIGRPYMNYRVVDLIAERAGIASRVPTEIVHRATQATSDFPLLLANAATQALRQAYQAATPVYRAVATRRRWTNFKPQSFVSIGDFPRLLPLGENGEIKHGAVPESAEAVRLKTYARIFGLTRQAIINDDLGAFGDVVTGAGRASSRTESELFVQLLASNSWAGPTMSDGQAMFHAAHSNLAPTGAAIDVTSLSAARTALRKQKNLDGDPLAPTPRIILVGPDKETEADKVVASITPAASEDVNPFSAKQSVVTEGRITGTNWYNFADPERDGSNFVYGYLGDAEAPLVEQKSSFSYDGVQFRVVHDFAIGAVDYRFGYRNPGA